MKKVPIKNIEKTEILKMHGRSQLNETFEKTLIMEQGRGKLFEEFILKFFKNADNEMDKVLKSTDGAGIKGLKSGLDEMVNSGQLKRVDADEFYEMMKRNSGRLADEMESGYDNFLKKIGRDNNQGPARGEFLINLVNKKFTDQIVYSMKKEVIRNLRGTVKYGEILNQFQNIIFNGLIRKYENAIAKGETFTLSREQIIKNLKPLMIKVDTTGIFKNLPEFYDDFVEKISEEGGTLDQFLQGTLKGFEGGKNILKKQTREIFKDAAQGNIKPFTDEEINYLDQRAKQSSGVLGNFRQSLSDFYKSIKGLNQTAEEMQTQTLSMMNKLLDENLTSYDKQTIIDEVSKNLKILQNQDTKLKNSFDDFVDKTFPIDDPKLGEINKRLKSVGLKDGLSDLANAAGDNVDGNFVTWVSEAWKRQGEFTSELRRSSLKRIGKSIKKILSGQPISGTAMKLAEKLTKTDQVVTKAGYGRDYWADFWEFFYRGSISENSVRGKKIENLLNMGGLEFFWNLIALPFNKNKRQYLKKLTQLGTQYVRGFVVISGLWAFGDLIFESLTWLITTGVFNKTEGNPEWIQQQIDDLEEHKKRTWGSYVGLSTPAIEETSGLEMVFNVAVNTFFERYAKNSEWLLKIPGYFDDFMIRFAIPVSESWMETKNQKKLEQYRQNFNNEMSSRLVMLENGDMSSTNIIPEGQTGQYLQKQLIGFGHTDALLKLQKLSPKGFTTDARVLGLKTFIEKTGYNIPYPLWRFHAKLENGENFGINLFNTNDVELVGSGDVLLRFKNGNDLKGLQYLPILSTSSKNNEYIKNSLEKGWKDIPLVEGKNSTITYEHNTKTQPKNKTIMERIRKYVILENQRTKFGLDNFKHWNDTFTFQSEDEKNPGQFKDVKINMEDVMDRIDHYRKKYDEDDAFVRAVIDTHEDVIRIMFTKDLANIHETVKPVGLAYVLSVLRESRGEMEIWTVSRPANGNWFLVKGDFNKKQLANMELKKVEPKDKTVTKKEKPEEGLKKKEQEAIELLKTNESEGLHNLPSKVKEKVKEKLRKGWVVEKPYEFFDEFYTKSDINSAFNDKIEIYKLNPTKEFFESLKDNASKVFLRRGFCKSLNSVKNDTSIDEKSLNVVKHLINKCDTKFKENYGITQI